MHTLRASLFLDMVTEKGKNISKYTLYMVNILICIYPFETGAHGSVVVKALYYKPEGCGFST
jgi:hypothetical protein